VIVSDSLETPRPGSPFSQKIRTLAVGALATAALTIPAFSAVSVVAHEASKAPTKAPVKAPVVSPSSHRLALSITRDSVRLT